MITVILGGLFIFLLGALTGVNIARYVHNSVIRDFDKKYGPKK